MTNLNSVFLIGNLTKDIEFGYGQSGTAVARGTIAVNSSRKQGNEYVDEASFFFIKIFGKTAENLKPYLVKGQKIGICGKLHQDRWTDKNGQNQSIVVVSVDSIELLGGKKDGENQRSNNSVPYPARQEGFTEEASSDFPEDIPF